MLDDLVDTDKAFENFLHACQTVCTPTFMLHMFVDGPLQAGPHRCALASDKSTAKSIGTRVDKFLSDIYDYPLPVDKAKRPGALTSGMVRGTAIIITSLAETTYSFCGYVAGYIFTNMYGPRTWPELAKNLAAAMNGNGTAIMDYVQGDVELDTSVKARTSQAISAVTCVDTPPFPASVDKTAVVQKNIDEAVLTYELTSKRFAPLELDMCHHWTPRETERFTGADDDRIFTVS
jgi:hypothetical protein